MSDAIVDATDGCRIHLHVVPRASRTQIAGLHDGRLKLQVAAPPVFHRSPGQLALVTPVMVESLPASRPIWPSTVGRYQTSSPVSAS